MNWLVRYKGRFTEWFKRTRVGLWLWPIYVHTSDGCEFKVTKVSGNTVTMKENLISPLQEKSSIRKERK